MIINKIYNEDCLVTMSNMSDDYIDLVVTSPPYDKLRKYNGFSFDFDSISKQLYRIMKPGGCVIWVVGDSTINGTESLTSFKQAIKFTYEGFLLHDTMIYAKENFIPLTHNRYEQEFEYMFCFSKGKPKTFNPIKVECKGGGESYNLKRKGYCSTIKEGAQRRRDEIVVTNTHKIKGNIFYYTLGSEITGHPAPFPEKLCSDQIQSWSNEGDLIYDPFGGSGTTAKSAIRNRRNFILSEISSEYCELSNKRIEPLLQMQTMF